MTTEEEDVWRNSFHWCALAAGFLAVSEGRLADARYVRDLTYAWYEEGAFKDRATNQHRKDSR